MHRAARGFISSSSRKPRKVLELNSVPGQFSESENSVALETCVPEPSSPLGSCMRLRVVIYSTFKERAGCILPFYCSYSSAVLELLGEGFNTESRTGRHFGKVHTPETGSGFSVYIGAQASDTYYLVASAYETSFFISPLRFLKALIIIVVAKG